MFTNTLLPVYSHFSLGFHRYYRGFCHRLLWVYSYFSPGFTHSLLRFYSHVALVLFTLFSGFYSLFTPGLFTLYFKLTHSVLSVFTRTSLWVFLTLYQYFTHTLLQLYSLFTQGLLTLYTTLLSMYTHPSVQDLSH